MDAATLEAEKALRDRRNARMGENLRRLAQTSASQAEAIIGDGRKLTAQFHGYLAALVDALEMQHSGRELASSPYYGSDAVLLARCLDSLRDASATIAEIPF